MRERVDRESGEREREWRDRGDRVEIDGRRPPRLMSNPDVTLMCVCTRFLLSRVVL